MLIFIPTPWNGLNLKQLCSTSKSQREKVGCDMGSRAVSGQEFAQKGIFCMMEQVQ
jgi:hypothetical protein